MLGLFTTKCDVDGVRREMAEGNRDRAESRMSQTFTPTRGITADGNPAAIIPTSAIPPGPTAPCPPEAVRLPGTQSRRKLFGGKGHSSLRDAAVRVRGPGVYWLPISLSPIDPPPR